MSYIQIFLVSCSIAGLLGEYFSIVGEGRYIYLTFASIITSGIYYYYYKLKKSDILYIGTFLTQVFSIILFTLFLDTNILLITTNLLLYNIILILLKDKLGKIDLLEYFYNGIPYISGIVVICFLSTEKNIFLIPLLVVLAFNFLLLKRIGKNEILNTYILNIVIYILGFYIIFSLLEISKNLEIILVTIYTVLIWGIEEYLSKVFKDKDLSKSSLFIAIIVIGIIYIYCLTQSNLVLKPYMLSIIEMILLACGLLKSSPKEKNVFGYLISISFIVTGLDILHLLNAQYYWYIIFSIMNLIIGEIIIHQNFENLKRGISLISHIFILITCLSVFIENESEFMKNTIILSLLELTYIYSFIKNKEYKIFKYIAYILNLIVFMSITNWLNLPEMIAPLLTTIIILTIENRNKKIRDDFSSVVSQIITYVFLITSENAISILLGFLFTAYLIFDNFINEKNKYLRCIPSFCLLVILLSDNFQVYENYQIILMISSTIALSVISIYNRKISIDTIFSGLYLLFALDYFDNNIIQQIFFIIWSFSNMCFMENDKDKDLFKGLTYLGTYLLYNSTLEKMGIDEYNAFFMIGLMIFAIAMLKNILKKHFKDMDSIEYLVYSLVNLISLIMYTSEKDGMIYVTFMVLVLIYSYTKKYGILFVVSLFTILFNILIITIGFWLLIPWWIYLLAIGSVLIGFAVKNESDEKKNKINVGNAIKKIRDKVEK